MVKGEVENESKSPKTYKLALAGRLFAAGRMPECAGASGKIRGTCRLFPSQDFDSRFVYSLGQRHPERVSAFPETWRGRFEN
jgi:hypothetical protein